MILPILLNEAKGVVGNVHFLRCSKTSKNKLGTDAGEVDLEVAKLAGG
jgi:hypothetical protein